LKVGGSPLESFETIARVSCEAVFEAKRAERKFFLHRFIIWLEEVLMEVRLFLYFKMGPPFLSTKEAIARVKNSAYQQFSTIV
jgi:uncharacterized Fe-S cluster-containing MiaB family protein